MNISIRTPDLLSLITNMEFWPWGYLTFDHDQNKYALDIFNEFHLLSPHGYEQLKVWAKSSNKINSDMTDGLTIIPVTNKTRALSLDNLKSEQKSIEERKKVFGADVTTPPFEDPLYKTIILGKTMSTGEDREVKDAYIFLSVPQFENLKPHETLPEIAKTYLSYSGDALTLEEIEYADALKYEIRMGIEVTSYKDRYGNYAQMGKFYFWPLIGKLEFVETSDELRAGPPAPYQHLFKECQYFYPRL